MAADGDSKQRGPLQAPALPTGHPVGHFGAPFNMFLSSTRLTSCSAGMAQPLNPGKCHAFPAACSAAQSNMQESWMHKPSEAKCCLPAAV